MKRIFTLVMVLWLAMSSAGIYAGNFRLYVDDPSKVDLMMAYSFNYISDLTPGEWNDVEFGNDDVELVVRSIGGSGCYSVKKDGISISQDGSLYKVPLSDGCEIEIIAEFPSENYPVEFVFNGCMEDCIASLEINYKPVTDFLSPGFSVAAGSRLSFTGNRSDYKFDSLKVNGEDADYDMSDGYTTLVTGPLLFEITAHRYRDFSVTININNPDGVTLMRENSTTPVYLKVGDNNVIFNEKNTRLTITPNEGYKLTCLRSGDKDYLSEYSSYNQSIRVEEGMLLEIGVEPLEQITTVVYFDDTEGLNLGDLVNDSWEDYAFSQGYNVYTLFEGHNSFLFIPSATPAGIYLNGVRQESKYGDSWLCYEFMPERNDVVKVFMLAEPEIYRLTFEPTTAGDDRCSIFYDMVISVEDTATPLEVLGRTCVTVVPEIADDTFSVIANDIVVMPDADGVYTIDITGDTTLKYGSASAIVSNPGSARPNHVKNVYNLQGILILSDATESEISELPAGLYIIDGQKRYVRN